MILIFTSVLNHLEKQTERTLGFGRLAVFQSSQFMPLSSDDFGSPNTCVRMSEATNVIRTFVY